MKDEKVWDYSICNIGHPCQECIKKCSFKKPTVAYSDQDEKEKKYERITESNENRI